MYERHFGLKDKPFNLIPDPDYLYLSPKHRVGLSMLEYGLMETAAGITVITGDVGAGKTTLIRKLMRRIDYNELTVGVINNTDNFQEDLMTWVANAFNLPHEGKDEVAQFRDFQRFLIDEYARGRRCVLIVDEAQNLGIKALERLRMLTNINADRDQLVQIVLVGQPELFDILKRPELSQIAQRVSVEFHLEPLELSEVMGYIQHRLEVAGTQREIFQPEAVAAIFYYSGGVPRLVNTLCDYSMVHAYALGLDTIGLDTVQAVVAGRRIGGLNRSDKQRDARDAVRDDILARTGKDLAAAMAG
ncbi:MAG: AAA family ATPase [Spongiibacteraceae bacterium]|jgi:type II secretory pathway predicted ATPase ExeA|nr:AAA family ATPase [Spongiibacteraceae bacterium]